MAKSKNKHKHKVHQPQKLITQIQARKAMEEYCKKNAVEQLIETRVSNTRWRAFYIAAWAVHEAFGIGEQRLLEKFVPALEDVSKQYEEWSKGDNQFYADRKLEEVIQQICPSQLVHIGDGVLDLDDGSYIE